MKLTLAIPALHRRYNETLSILNLPAFNQILRFAQHIPHPTLPSEFYSQYLWKSNLSSIAKQKLNLDPNQNIIFASPVFQQMNMHNTSIISGQHIHIQGDEAKQICDELSIFYQDEQWQFYPLFPDLWVITTPMNLDWQVSSILDICGQISEAEKAQGQDARQWLQKQTEIQMWLHSHSINTTRNHQKLPALNGLWLWKDLHGTQHDFSVLASDCTWAHFFHGQRIDLPHHFQAWIDTLSEENINAQDSLIFLDDLTLSNQLNDDDTYQETLHQWEKRWFAPIWQALSTGQLTQLTISTDGEYGCKLILTPKSKWAFWKSKKTFNGQLPY